jgi:L-asparagine transporter-like permease
MNFVVLSAALSCIDTGIYATSRMLFSLSREGYFSKKFSQLHQKRQTPVYAIAVSSAVLYVGALAALYSPNAYVWLASLSGFGFLFAWLMITISQPLMRKQLEKDDPASLRWKVPFYPYSQYIALLLIAAVFIGLFFSKNGREILLSGIIWLIFAGLYYFYTKIMQKKKGSA